MHFLRCKLSKDMGVTYFASKGNFTRGGGAENGSLRLSSGRVWDHPSSGQQTKKGKFRVSRFVADNYIPFRLPPRN